MPFSAAGSGISSHPMCGALILLGDVGGRDRGDPSPAAGPCVELDAACSALGPAFGGGCGNNGVEPLLAPTLEWLAM